METNAVNIEQEFSITEIGRVHRKQGDIIICGVEENVYLSGNELLDRIDQIQAGTFPRAVLYHVELYISEERAKLLRHDRCIQQEAPIDLSRPLTPQFGSPKFLSYNFHNILAPLDGYIDCMMSLRELEERLNGLEYPEETKIGICTFGRQIINPAKDHVAVYGAVGPEATEIFLQRLHRMGDN